MKGVNVACGVRPIDEKADRRGEEVVILSHGNWENRIILRIGDTDLVFVADELVDAIRRASK